MPPQPQLSVELLDHILSFLRDPDDHPSLRCCAEVGNQVFSDMVERHLYHRVKLNNYSSDCDADDWETGKLAKLLTEKPHLGSYTRILVITIVSKDLHRKPLTKEVKTIGEMLAMFTQITTIELFGRSWNKLHQTFQEAFARMLCQTASLENVSIIGAVSFPLPLLNYCRYLKHLSLRGLTKPLLDIADLPNDTQSLPDNERSQLLSLEILDDFYCYLEAFPAILTWLFSPGSPTIKALSSLQTDVPKERNAQLLDALMEACSSQLKEVHLCALKVAVQTEYDENHEIIYSSESDPHRILKFQGCHSLRFLSISGSLSSPSTFVPRISDMDVQLDNGRTHALTTFVPWFVQALQTFDASNNLEEIVLNTNIYINLRRPFVKPDWQPLARTLTSKSFPSLRGVKMHVGWPAGHSLNFPSPLPLIRGDVHLSSLVQSGLLSITEDEY